VSPMGFKPFGVGRDFVALHAVLLDASTTVGLWLASQDVFGAYDPDTSHAWKVRSCGQAPGCGAAQRFTSSCAAREDDLIMGNRCGISGCVARWVLRRHRRHWPHPTGFVPIGFAGQSLPRTSGSVTLPFGACPRICFGAPSLSPRSRSCWPRYSCSTLFDVQAGPSQTRMGAATSGITPGWSRFRQRRQRLY